MNDKEAKETLKTMKENIDKKYLKTRNLVAIETVLNLLENQKAELDNLKTIEEENKFLRNQELGYIAGYEDGKKYKMTAVAMRIENMKYELYESHIKALKKRIEDLLSIEEAHRKENGKLRAEIEEKDKSLKLHKKLEYQYKNDYLNVIEDLKKKDKQIDLMAEEIAFNYDINSYADVITIKKQLKERYEKKAEEE